MLTRVDLPEPDGAEMMKRIPAKRSFLTGINQVYLKRKPDFIQTLNFLLEVLDLFARLFYLGFNAQSKLGNGGSVTCDAARLREQGVGLAVHLLQQEVRLLANFTAGAQ